MPWTWVMGGVATLLARENTLGTMRHLGLWLLGGLFGVGHALDLGYGGLPGQRTPRTGSVWPPHPGANQGYWARQAGFYNSLPNFSSPTIPTTRRLYTSPTITPAISRTFPASPTIRAGPARPTGLSTLYRPYQLAFRRYQQFP